MFFRIETKDLPSLEVDRVEMIESINAFKASSAGKYLEKMWNCAADGPLTDLRDMTHRSPEAIDCAILANGMLAVLDEAPWNSLERALRKGDE